MIHRNTILLIALLPCALMAQDRVEVSSYSFSDGVHPTFRYLFEGTDAKFVENWWRDELKNISASVSSKKELVASSVLVPRISSDTLRIQVKTEQHKGSPHTLAHVAIKSTEGYIGPDSDPRSYDGAMAFVEQHTIALRRQLAQQELTNAEKGLSLLKKEMSDLLREEERARSSIEKQKQRAAEAVGEQESTRREIDELASALVKQRNALSDGQDEDQAKELASLQKEHDRTMGRHQKALDGEVNALKKVSELEWTVHENLAEQEKKREAIAEQEIMVDALRSTLERIK